MKKQAYYYLITFALFVLFKFAYRYADTDMLLFLLKPTDKLISILTTSNSIYMPDIGFYHKQIDIVIDKSCAGFNFWMLSFLMLSFLGLKYVSSKWRQLGIIPLALIGAYILTLFVNTSRIFVAISIQNQTKSLSINQHIIHEAIGIVTNLSFLIIAYFLIDKILIKTTNYEKLA